MKFKIEPLPTYIAKLSLNDKT